MAKKKKGAFGFGEKESAEGKEEGITKAQLTALSALVKEHTDLGDKIELIEERLKNAKKELEVLVKGRIPEIMVNAEIMSITLNDGTKLKLDKKLIASVMAANKDKAIAWLDEHEFGDLVKDEHKITLLHSDKARGQTLSKMLKEIELESEIKVSIHPQTLGALVRSQINEGNTDFSDTDVRSLLGITQLLQAKITLPK